MSSKKAKVPESRKVEKSAPRVQLKNKPPKEKTPKVVSTDKPINEDHYFYLASDPDVDDDIVTDVKFGITGSDKGLRERLLVHRNEINNDNAVIIFTAKTSEEIAESMEDAFDKVYFPVTGKEFKKFKDGGNGHTEWRLRKKKEMIKQAKNHCVKFGITDFTRRDKRNKFNRPTGV